MKYKIFGLVALMAAFTFVSAAQTQAETDVPEGSIFKGKGNPTIYYLSEDGKRYVFPNEKTFRSWYEDFDGIVEVEDQELGDIPLGGNVVYKPGVYLVKITTDPKVYAVSGNGRLRWLKTEAIARALYGTNWNLLVDDVPDSFFVNYSIDEPIDNEEDFDPIDAEEEVKTIDQNKRAFKRFARKVRTQTRECENLERQFNKLQERLANFGVEIEGLGDNFITKCVDSGISDETDTDGDSDDNDDSDDDIKNHKVRICHKGGDGRETLTIAKAALKAHLRHGDKIGKCKNDQDDDDDDDSDNSTDTTPPVISSITADVTTSTATINWSTNETSTSRLFYSTSSPVLSSDDVTEVTDSDLVFDHEFTIDDLIPNTVYYFIVKSTDEAGNTGVSNEEDFTTDEVVTPDVTAPIISDIAFTIGSTTTTITWMTDEPATSKVVYANESLATASSTDMVSDTAFVTEHSIELTGLATSTQYYFNVESKDESDNTATSTEQDFTTNS